MVYVCGGCKIIFTIEHFLLLYTTWYRTQFVVIVCLFLYKILKRIFYVIFIDVKLKRVKNSVIYYKEINYKYSCIVIFLMFKWKFLPRRLNVQKNKQKNKFRFNTLNCKLILTSPSLKTWKDCITSLFQLGNPY